MREERKGGFKSKVLGIPQLKFKIKNKILDAQASVSKCFYFLEMIREWTTKKLLNPKIIHDKLYMYIC